jgi:hypothetical protein
MVDVECTKFLQKERKVIDELFVRDVKLYRSKRKKYTMLLEQYVCRNVVGIIYDYCMYPVKIIQLSDDIRLILNLEVSNELYLASLPTIHQQYFEYYRNLLSRISLRIDYLRDDPRDRTRYTNRFLKQKFVKKDYRSNHKARARYGARQKD